MSITAFLPLKEGRGLVNSRIGRPQVCLLKHGLHNPLMRMGCCVVLQDEENVALETLWQLHKPVLCERKESVRSEFVIFKQSHFLKTNWTLLQAFWSTSRIVWSVIKEFCIVRNLFIINVINRECIRAWLPIMYLLLFRSLPKLLGGSDGDKVGLDTLQVYQKKTWVIR